MSTPTPDRARLLELAERVEASEGPDRILLNEVAEAVGWQRVTPSQMGRSHRQSGGWISPEDYAGRYDSGRPILDSLHGTTIHREPPPFLTSLDAAMGLAPADHLHAIWYPEEGIKVQMWDRRRTNYCGFGVDVPEATAATYALALTAASLRARAAGEA